MLSDLLLKEQQPHDVYGYSNEEQYNPDHVGDDTLEPMNKC